MAITFTAVALPQLVKGDQIRITTSATAKSAGETLTGSYVGQASTGIRIKVDGKTITRATSRIIKLEREELTVDPAPAAADEAPGAPDDATIAAYAETHHLGAEGAERIKTAFAQVIAEQGDEVPAELAADSSAGETTVATDPAQPEADVVPISEVMDTAAAAYVAATPAPAESNEDAPAEFDADPEVDGKRLSAMTFAEVMVLAKRYKTPGRGVARIGALREGVAKAIAGV